MLILNSLGLGLVTIVLASSAYGKSLAFLVVILGRSFISKRKNNGPRIEPCGTPHLIFSHLEEVLL